MQLEAAPRIGQAGKAGEDETAFLLRTLATNGFVSIFRSASA